MPILPFRLCFSSFLLFISLANFFVSIEVIAVNFNNDNSSDRGYKTQHKKLNNLKVITRRVGDEEREEFIAFTHDSRHGYMTVNQAAPPISSRPVVSSVAPSEALSVAPSEALSAAPSVAHSAAPSVAHSAVPSEIHSAVPSEIHSAVPSEIPFVPITDNVPQVRTTVVVDLERDDESNGMTGTIAGAAGGLFLILAVFGGVYYKKKKGLNSRRQDNNLSGYEDVENGEAF